MNSIEILYEDNHLLVINKPSGILSQGDQTGDKPLIEYCKDYIKKKYKKPGAVFLGLVHRLDRPTSGVIVFARTSKALIPEDRTTVGSLLKNNGYQTAFIGKWHLGWNWGLIDSSYYEDRVDIEKIDFNKEITHSPNDLGFQYSYGHNGSLDMPPYVYVENKEITAKIDRTIRHWNNKRGIYNCVLHSFSRWRRL